MSRPSRQIDRFMSSVVIQIDPSQTLSEASRLMRLHEIRHLPVVSKGRVVGLLSQREAYLVQALAPLGTNHVLVSEAMRRDPYMVKPDQPADRVAGEMARRGIGSAVVAHEGKLLGLFTTTDALLALAALLRDQTIPMEECERARARAEVERTIGP